MRFRNPGSPNSERLPVTRVRHAGLDTLISLINIWRGCIFVLLTLLHLICFSSAFQLSILSEVYYLNFLRLSENMTVDASGRVKYI